MFFSILVLYFLALESSTLGPLYLTRVSTNTVHWRRKARSLSSVFYPVELPNPSSPAITRGLRMHLNNTEFCEHCHPRKAFFLKSQNRKFQAIETHRCICLKVFWNNKTACAYQGKQTIIKADVSLTHLRETRRQFS